MFKDYKGFDNTKIKQGTVVRIDDIERDEEDNCSGVYLVNEVNPFQIKLVDVQGGIIALDVDNFLGNWGHYAPCTRMEIEIISN